MFSLKGTYFNDVYPAMINLVMNEGHDIDSRWEYCRELTPVVAEVKHPLNHLVTSSGRPVNVAFALAEVIWILSGRRDVAFVEPFNSQIAQFSDDGTVFNAAYGYRLRHEFGIDQIADTLKLLADDPNTRQAVINTWSPQSDSAYEFSYETGGMVKRQTKDRACNTQSMLILRNGLLHWRQLQRSNDMIWGTPYNWMQFSHLQAWFADALGVGVGSYTHFINSLHVYESYWEESVAIKRFDLYEHLGYHHPLAGTSNKETLNWLEEWVMRISVGDKPPETMNDPQYWTGVLWILHAHMEYKKGFDLSCIESLSMGDAIYAAAQARFYWKNRWHKMGDADRVRMIVDDLYRLFPDAVVEWICAEK